MKYSAILPDEKPIGGGDPPPLGVHVVYEEGDHEELEHLLLALEEYFDIPEAPTPPKGKRAGMLMEHPYFQLGDTIVSLPYMLSRIPDLEDIGLNSVIGFYYPGNPYKRRSRDITTFRAYKAHLRDTGKDWAPLREMYQAIEDEFFPQGKRLS